MGYTDQQGMSERRHPYTIEVSALIQARMLIYAEDIEEMNDIISLRTEELCGDLASAASIPPPEQSRFVMYDITARESEGHEVGGSDALPAGMLMLTDMADLLQEMIDEDNEED